MRGHWQTNITGRCLRQWDHQNVREAFDPPPCSSPPRCAPWRLCAAPHLCLHIRVRWHRCSVFTYRRRECVHHLCGPEQGHCPIIPAHSTGRASQQWHEPPISPRDSRSNTWTRYVMRRALTGPTTTNVGCISTKGYITYVPGGARLTRLWPQPQRRVLSRSGRLVLRLTIATAINRYAEMCSAGDTIAMADRSSGSHLTPPMPPRRHLGHVVLQTCRARRRCQLEYHFQKVPRESGSWCSGQSGMDLETPYIKLSSSVWPKPPETAYHSTL